MQKDLNSQGYDLYEVTPHEWIFHVKGHHIYHGTLTEVGELAVRKYGFSKGEIERAVMKFMHKLGHNGAHFGVNKTFIYSFEREFGHVERAS